MREKLMEKVDYKIYDLMGMTREQFIAEWIAVVLIPIIGIVLILLF